MTRAKSGQRRTRGSIDSLPSGGLRVRVYAGVDPVSGRGHYLTETVQAGPKADVEAEKIRTRLLAQVDEKRNPRTSATVNQLLDRYFSVVELDESTLRGYERNSRVHIRPIIGTIPAGRIDGEAIDALYAQLRTCRAHCQGRAYAEHRTQREHLCDDRCGSHKCRPLSNASIRQVHNVLSGAFSRAVRWRWIGTNPMDQAAKPSTPIPNPQPPSQSQAARIIMAAWKDPDWGMLIWLAMTTGARRGELCALRWDRVDFDRGVLRIDVSITQDGSALRQKDTKNHQQRRVVLDPQTVGLLRAYHEHIAERAKSLDVALNESCFIFSSDPAGRVGLRPDTVTQRYTRMCKRLGWDMHIHQLRHYSATELISSGVDIRTVAGRLGHGGGGATTLRVYTAWVSEADQRAAKALAAGMPELPESVTEPGRPALPAVPTEEPTAPYMGIVADLRGAIRCGALNSGDPLPPAKELARRYGVAASTAHRAVAVLTANHEATASRGKRAVVA